MRANILGAFAIGVATGFLVLGVALWGSGVIHTQDVPHSAAAAAPAVSPGVAPAGAAPQKPPEPSVPFDLNALTAEAKKMPAPHVEPPPPPLPSPTGGADRIAPDIPAPAPPHLAMPLSGIDPKSLIDTFQDKRDGRTHDALDIPAARGTPVRAVAEGNVVKLFTSKQGGLTVYQFDDSQKWCFYYAHLDRYAPGLKEGTLLRKGDVLGYVGSTGDASPSAPHLHLAVFRLKPDKKWWQGTAVDPLPLLR